ncbi:VOC family protein [Plectonema cf. radiosum LEGE 06105]|uniref:VOC family protein n=1 Tax=Plectonema cf. radiosum LEGE 06105 TaxID=945769 RepID=A0A8J7JTT1_9CYAN|nr:VOC family protein [Plectonema radiosum]MBE9214169.1 VOC family protein [Plectonema cf. radiosum LEGE 06105]
MANQQKAEIQGIYEVCIGVIDAISAIQYWQKFGYHIGDTGELTATDSDKLYGINSALRSIRLFHQNSDHGLIRLMTWEKPINQGLGITSMKVKGNRWATTLTNDCLNILNHIESAKAAGETIKYTNPSWEVIYNKERKIRPFIDEIVGVREMLLLQPLTRQVLFQRFGYNLPNYGNVNQNSAFKTSQFTHMGIIVQDDSKEILNFYEEALGLLRVRDDVETSYESSVAGREIFDLEPGEKFIVTAFDEPRSSTTDLFAARSGRLYIIRFPEFIQLKNEFEKAQPGCLGMCLYTYRVSFIEDYLKAIQSSSAKNITAIENNEFGEKSFSFTAPDGYFWTIIS